jgi:hypothetical protein
VNVKDFTTDVMNDFYVGTEIFLSVDSPTPFANPYAYMFTGVIDSANVSVIPGEDYSTITIQARSYSSLQLNTDVGLTKNESTVKSTLISTAAAIVGNFVDLDTSAYNFKGTARESKSLGDWLTDLALCDFMQMRDTYFPVYVYQNGFLPSTWSVAWQRNMRFRITKNTSTSVGTLTDAEISDMQLDWSGAGSPTGVTLTNYTDPEIIYQYGSTTADAGGSFSYVATVDVKDLTQMTAIGQQLLAMNKAFTPIQITTTTATNNQSLVWKDITLDASSGGLVTFYYSPDKLYDIGETITIDLPEFGVDEVDMIITGREINVDPDNWTTTYTLWKGFTN